MEEENVVVFSNPETFIIILYNSKYTMIENIKSKF